MKKWYMVLGIVIALVSLSVSYAYFTGNLSGEDSKVKVASKDVQIIFTDGTAINENDIRLGWNVSKNFSVENRSSDLFNYKIVIKDLINTFVSDGLQYKIISSNGYSMDDYLPVPKSAEASDVILASDIYIDPGDLQEYTIEFRYIDLDEDQSADMYKIFEGTLAIIEGVIDANKKYSVTLNVDNATVGTNPLETTRGGNVTFNLNVNEAYELGESVVCDGGATGKIEGNNVIVSDIKKDQTCTIETVKKQYTVTVDVKNGSTSPTNVIVDYGDTKEFTITPNSGYTLTGGTVSGTGCTLSGDILTVNNVKSNVTCTLTLMNTTKFLYGKILADHPSRGTERPNAFDGVYTEENTKTLYETTKTENGNKSYYFAGNAQDNWVYFAGIYWRIIRINEDNSVRLLYVGPDKNTTRGYINETTSAYNSTSNHPRYVGYMYGSSTGSLANDRGNNTNSTIKGVIDSWYGTNITGKNDGTNTYDKYVSRTAIYCNDRSISSGSYSTRLSFYFGARGRLESAKSPSYKCGANTSNGLYESSQAVADKFSGSTTGGGNGKLSSAPAALMTADEVSYAGGRYGTNAPAWYHYNAAGESVVAYNFWWTMSPSAYSMPGVDVSVHHVSGLSEAPGKLSGIGVQSPYAVRPVLSLKSCVLSTGGNGSNETPYRVEIGSTCTDANN